MKVEFLKDAKTKHNPKKYYKQGRIYGMGYKLGMEYIKEGKARRVDVINEFQEEVIKKSNK